MKYELTKCNNLNFKIKDGTTGYIKTNEAKSMFYIYFDKDKNSCFDVSLQINVDALTLVFGTLAEFEKWAIRNELEIIPRNSETYTDWKVGDFIQNKFTKRVCIITAKLGHIFYIGERVFIYSAEDLKEKFKLVLTEYEKELSETTEEKVIPFKKGDKVLVKDVNTMPWDFNVFRRYEKGREYPYYCEDGDSYKQCIPFNEKTWKLLGTTDVYEEDLAANE